MKYITIIALSSILILASCGKKEDTQNTSQENQTQLTQQPTTNNGQTTQQQTTNNGQEPQQTTNNGQAPQQTTDNGEAPKQQTTKDTTKKDIKKSEENKTEANKTDAVKKNTTDKTQNSKIYSQDSGELSQSDIDFASIFAKKCAKCHGKNGHGKPDGAPNLTADNVRSKSDSQLLAILKNGIKAKNPDDDDMPAWNGKLSDDELQAAIKYIRSLP